MSQIFKRDKYLRKVEKYLNVPLIKVITGLRRAWKSYFLKSIFELVKEKGLYEEKEIFYINKELLEFDFIKNYLDLNNYFLKWKKENNIETKFLLAVDEIQEIEFWEKFVNSILAEYWEKADIFITGSNSNLLSSKLSTYIAWRYIEFHIFSLDFEEFAMFSKKEANKELFLEYLKYGGLPWIFRLNREDEIIKEYLAWVYRTIFIKDVLNTYNIKNTSFFEKLYLYLLKNIWTLFSANSIKNYIKSENISISIDTIINYINYSKETYLIYDSSRFDIKWKKILTVSNKFYVWDIWIRNALVWFNFASDIWNILENIVFLELLWRWYKVQIWVLWDKEIDFIAERFWEKKYFQVCYLLSDEKVVQREFGNLLQINDNREKYVLSMDDIFETKYEWIIHKNIINWLLESK